MLSDFFSLSNLGCVPDDDEHARVFGFELGEIGKPVLMPVDAAKGPEIQQDDAPFEVGQGDLLVGVEPIGPADKSAAGKPLQATGF